MACFNGLLHGLTRLALALWWLDIWLQNLYCISKGVWYFMWHSCLVSRLLWVPRITSDIMHCWFYLFQVSHYCQLCYNSTIFSGAQHRCGNYYLYMNEQPVVTPNLTILVSTEVLFVFLNIYDRITKTHSNMESCKLFHCMCALVHLNLEPLAILTTSGP